MTVVLVHLSCQGLHAAVKAMLWAIFPLFTGKAIS